MTGIAPSLSPSTRSSTVMAAIFDVDGVLLASPHERAWREALVGFADPTRLHHRHVSGRGGRQTASQRC